MKTSLRTNHLVRNTVLKSRVAFTGAGIGLWFGLLAFGLHHDRLAVLLLAIGFCSLLRIFKGPTALWL